MAYAVRKMVFTQDTWATSSLFYFDLRNSERSFFLHGSKGTRALTKTNTCLGYLNIISICMY